MKLLKTFAALLSLPALVFSAQSSIDAPANGTHIAPGASFPFSYHTDADYCESSFGFNVFIFTKKPTNFKMGEIWNTGAFLGRYSEPNYPGNPDPTNPPPPTFTMPDFSSSPGGFGTGKHATNKPVYLVVLEESSGCEVSLWFLLFVDFIVMLRICLACSRSDVCVGVCYFDLQCY